MPSKIISETNKINQFDSIKVKDLLFLILTIVLVVTPIFIAVNIKDKGELKEIYENLGVLINLFDKTAGPASNNLSINIEGRDAEVSKPFKDEIQACWYYHANYNHSHPYTIFWEKPKDVYPKIRGIAKPAFWTAYQCIQKKDGVSLVGIEYTKHTIEVQIDKNEDFIPILTSYAYYKSELNINKEGRITDRKVLGDFYNKKPIFKYEFECKDMHDSKQKSRSGHDICHSTYIDFFKATEKKFKLVDSYPENEKERREIEEANFKELKKLEKENFNILRVRPSSNFDKKRNDYEEEMKKFKSSKEKDLAKFRKVEKEYKGYLGAFKLYINERETLHTKLIEEGCGVLSIEPSRREREKENNKIISLNEPSLVFLCYRESGGSHVRMMTRTSEEIEYE